MLTYDEAKRIVLQQLDRAIDGDSEEVAAPVDPAIVEDETIERNWGWVIFWNTRLYAETGDLEHAQVGTAPVCVSRQDGAAMTLQNIEPLEPEIRRFERRIGARPWWKFW
jgi:hypothetical protein